MGVILSAPYLVWLVLSALCFAVGEFFSKKFGLEPGWMKFALVMGSYFVGVLFWLVAITENNQLSIVGAIWSVLSLLATVLIGTLIFGEHLSALALVGIALGLVSVFILSIA